MSSIVLPRIIRVRLTGFTPIFKRAVELEVPEHSGPFLILGGNGLGKTTILQATIFGIAGPADKEIQPEREDKRYSWGAELFKKRLDDSAQAEVQVEMLIGGERVTVRRGMNSEKIRGVKFGDADWNTSKNAQELFEDFVMEQGGYRQFKDFRFLVHRLAYLPESRQNLVWHAEAQLQAMLLL